MKKICRKCKTDFGEEVAKKISSGSWKENFAKLVEVCDSCLNGDKREVKAYKGSSPHNTYNYAELLRGKNGIQD